MAEDLPIILAGAAATLGAVASSLAAILAARVFDRLGKINGTLKQHEDDLEHIKGGCPLWGNPAHKNEPGDTQ